MKRNEDRSDFCPFKTQCKPQTWIFYPGGSLGNNAFSMPGGVRWLGPPRGEPSREHPIARCPLCKRRLQVRATYNYGSGEEFAGWQIPEHKARVTRAKSPRRQSKKVGRGK